MRSATAKQIYKAVAPVGWTARLEQDFVLLLGSGAVVDAVDSQGQTALLLAAAVPNLGAAQKLLQYGADIHKQDSRGRSALAVAVLASCQAASSERAAFYSMAELLLLRGADADAADGEGCTPLHHAVACTARMVELIIQHRPDCNSDAADNEGGTPLHHAAVRGIKAIAAALIRSRASLKVSSLKPDTEDCQTGCHALLELCCYLCDAHLKLAGEDTETYQG